MLGPLLREFLKKLSRDLRILFWPHLWSSPLYFPYLDPRGKAGHEGYLGGRSGLKENGLKVVKHLERVVTISSSILIISNERYNCYLTMTG
jgi:hypothetical protein